jgi:uncharacterized membrane protein
VPRFISQLPRRSFLLFMAAGWVFILLASVTYFHFGTIPGFMRERLPLRFPSFYLVSLRVHVAAALVSLPLCIVLMTRFLQRRPKAHRWLGRIAGMTLLLALVPTGAVLAFSASGGPVVTAGFLLSGAIVAWGTVRGVAAARRRDLVTHRRAMRHVFAQMSVAVTSRALLMAAAAFTDLAPELVYVVALWVPVLGSAVVVELLSRTRSAPPFERIRRELLSLPHALRSHALARHGGRLGR